MSEWQPIETAPKDGSIVWVGVENEFGISAWSEEAMAFVCLDDQGCFWTSPTHWREIERPEPPK